MKFKNIPILVGCFYFGLILVWHTERVELLKRRIHVSWLIALVSFMFVLGVGLALSVQLFGWWVWVVGGALLLALSFWSKCVYILPLILIGGGVIGLAYGSQARGDLQVYNSLLGGQLSIEGHVKEDPGDNDKKQLILQLDNIRVSDHHLPGSIWVSITGHPDIKRGDEVVVMGELSKGFGTFAAVMYTAKATHLTRPSPGDIGRGVRDWFVAAVRVAIPEPQASLGIGYLTGQKSALPSDLSGALQIAGLSHVVVASGYNLTILVRLSRRVFMKVSKYFSTLASSIMIVGFVGVTGLSPSMTRAGLVSALSLATWYYGRRFHPFVLLPFAAAVTVFIQPSYAWGDLGWQLSFSAFAGVMIVAPLLQRFFFGDKEPGTLRQILGETVAAHIVTIPIIVASFGVLSNVAIPANLLIVPLVPLAMLLTFLSGVLALIVPHIAETLVLPTTWLLTYMTETAQYLAGLPWSQTHLEINWCVGLAYYMLLIGACVYMKKATNYSLREANIIE